MFRVLKSANYIIKNNSFVKINREKIRALAEKLSKEEIKIPGWDCNYHFFDNSWRTCEYLFVLDSLNFCFWAKNAKEKWQIQYEKNKNLNGYFALAFSLKKAVEKKIINFWNLKRSF